MSSRLAPDEPFPEDLETLPTKELEVLNSKIHRELEFEYQHNIESDPETEFRLEHLHDELDIREILDDDSEEVSPVRNPLDQLSSTPWQTIDENLDPGQERITG